MRRLENAHRPGFCWPLAGRLGLVLALAGLCSPGSSGPLPTGRAGAAAAVSATVVEPININGVLGGLFGVSEVLALQQGAASPSTGSVLIRLVNTVPAVVSSGGEGGSTLSLLIAAGRNADAGGLVATLNGLLEPLGGGTLQRELVAAVSMSTEAASLTNVQGQAAREGDERVAIVVAFN